MKKTVLASLLIGSVLTTSAFAYSGKCNQGNMAQNCNMMKDTNSFNCKAKQGVMKHKKDGSHAFYKALYQLNLDNSQRTKIKEIFQSNKTKMKGINEAFSSSSFDKDKFVEIVSSKRENMIKLKAQTIEDIYKILTSKQKEQLKVLLDLKADRFKG
ncbi:Spy/CpxP family protein refolding chaperone [Malaciobacter mytili]|uniref:Spy/CpxP family protein refolding chaperone n=1 Tax=Malaciobacter mytili TaxID=603050 RepID=UPI003A83A901